MIQRILLLLSCLSWLYGTQGETTVIRSARELAQTIHAGTVDIPFDITAQVTGISRLALSFTLRDPSGTATVSSLEDELLRNWPKPHRWDIVHIVGKTFNDDGDIKGRCRRLEIVTNAPPVAPRSLSARELPLQAQDGEYISLTGTVDDAFIDEIDSRCRFLVVNSGGERFFAVYDSETPTVASLVGADVRICGTFHPFSYSPRKHFGNHLQIYEPQDIAILSRPTGFPFSAPLLTDCTGLRPADIAKLDRRRILGDVLAVWDNDRLLIRAEHGRLVSIQLSNGERPVCGERIEAVGFPETDLYRVNLVRAVYRKLPGGRPSSEAINDTSLRGLLGNDTAARSVNTACHGRLLRVRGTVVNLHKNADGCGAFMLRQGDDLLLIDASAAPGALSRLDDGWEAEATGVCVIEAEEWRPNLVFPHIRNVRLVLRTKRDLVPLSPPPRETHARLLSVIGALLAALLGVGVWTLSLRRLAERRGRLLAEEALARAESDMKVYERTRLAVELHDALAQNLTGVSMAITAAERVADTDRNLLHRHLVTAAKTLRSCREGLRNCLWDLRSNALGEKDMNEAIRITLSPQLANVRLSVRFNVPREQFTDKTLHAILCVIRELTVNAIRHGGATEVKIAGAIEDDALRFSVRDDGCGFDPATAAGIGQGHFGLQGIRERVDALEGTFEIESKPGHGTRATVAIRLPKGGQT